MLFLLFLHSLPFFDCFIAGIRVYLPIPLRVHAEQKLSIHFSFDCYHFVRKLSPSKKAPSRLSSDIKRRRERRKRKDLSGDRKQTKERS